jgi:hypothetical protein
MITPTQGHLEIRTHGHVDIPTDEHMIATTRGHKEIRTHGHVDFPTCGHIDRTDTRRLRNRDTWTPRTHEHQGHMDTLTQGHMEKRTHGFMGAWTHRHMDADIDIQTHTVTTLAACQSNKTRFSFQWRAKPHNKDPLVSDV